VSRDLAARLAAYAALRGQGTGRRDAARELGLSDARRPGGTSAGTGCGLACQRCRIGRGREVPCLLKTSSNGSCA
jgi:hypothetical protein